MISAWISKKRSMNGPSSKLKPSRFASAAKASAIPFSQSIRVP